MKVSNARNLFGFKYRIEVVHGFSPLDHVVPAGIDGEFDSLVAARAALARGRAAVRGSHRVRCDIVRSDDVRFAWE